MSEASHSNGFDIVTQTVESLRVSVTSTGALSECQKLG